MLYIINNSFISIYKTIKKLLKTDKDNINSLYIILNFYMQIIIKTELNKKQINLLISNKSIIFITFLSSSYS